MTLQLDPAGEVRLDVFLIDAMEWLKVNDNEYFLRALALNMRYLTGDEYVPFDLQREIIEYAEAGRKKVRA